MLRERLGEEAGVCVVMCSCTRTAIICSGTDQYGSVAPVDVCRMSPSIAAPGQRLHGNTLQYWHRDSASGSVGSDAGRWQDCVRCGIGSSTLPTVLAIPRVARDMKTLLQRVRACPRLRVTSDQRWKAWQWPLANACEAGQSASLAG